MLHFAEEAAASWREGAATARPGGGIQAESDGLGCSGDRWASALLLRRRPRSTRIKQRIRAQIARFVSLDPGLN
jgi:hypothetical protein